MAKHVFLAFTRPVEGREDEFNAWQDGEHIPHGLKSEGFTGATRFRLADGQFTPEEGRAAYLTIWEIESDDIEATLAKALEDQMNGVWSEAIDAAATRTSVYTAMKN